MSLDEAGRYGIRRDETSGPGEPQTENLDGLFFGLGRVTAAERRVLEANPGIMDLLEGGEVADGCFFFFCWPPLRCFSDSTVWHEAPGGVSGQRDRLFWEDDSVPFRFLEFLMSRL